MNQLQGKVIPKLLMYDEVMPSTEVWKLWGAALIPQSALHPSDVVRSLYAATHTMVKPPP